MSRHTVDVVDGFAVCPECNQPISIGYESALPTSGRLAHGAEGGHSFEASAFAAATAEEETTTDGEEPAGDKTDDNNAAQAGDDDRPSASSPADAPAEEKKTRARS